MSLARKENFDGHSVRISEQCSLSKKKQPETFQNRYRKENISTEGRKVEYDSQSHWRASDSKSDNRRDAIVKSNSSRRTHSHRASAAAAINTSHRYSVDSAGIGKRHSRRSYSRDEDFSDNDNGRRSLAKSCHSKRESSKTEEQQTSLADSHYQAISSKTNAKNLEKRHSASQYSKTHDKDDIIKGSISSQEDDMNVKSISQESSPNNLSHDFITKHVPTLDVACGRNAVESRLAQLALFGARRQKEQPPKQCSSNIWQ